MLHRVCFPAVVLAATLALISCGGGGGDEDVTVTEFSESDKAALSGDWPLDQTTHAYLVKSDAEWQSLWSDRKAALVCDSSTPYNDAACAASGPPAVDFSHYSLVGLLLVSPFEFRSPTPNRVFLDANGRELVVEYRYSPPIKAPFYYVTGTRFFLVPKTDAELSARPKEIPI